MTPSIVVFAIGNPSRGDDALGPMLGTLIAARCDPQQVQVIDAFQLQVEDALELRDRRAALFIDAARPGTVAGLQLGPVEAAEGPTPFTHALSPAALLAVWRRVETSPPPPAALLAVEGESFELGAPLSAAAESRIAPALDAALDWIESHGDKSAFSTKQDQALHNV